MTVTVNGEPRDVAPGITLADVVSQVTESAKGVTESAKGVAAAVNGEVVPRRAWQRTQLADGAQVEIVTAVQGG